MVHQCDLYDCFSVDVYGIPIVGDDTRDLLGFYHCSECGLRIIDLEYEGSVAVFGQALCPYCLKKRGI